MFSTLAISGASAILVTGNPEEDIKQTHRLNEHLKMADKLGEHLDLVPRLLVQELFFQYWKIIPDLGGQFQQYEAPFLKTC